MKNDANIRNFIEISGNFPGKLRKIRGKSGNFHGIHSSTSCRMTRFCSRFRSFSRSFLDMVPIDSVFFSFSFLFIPQTIDFLSQMLKFS